MDTTIATTTTTTTTSKKRPARKHIYEEFKPIIQISDTEEDTTTTTNNNNMNQNLNIESPTLAEFKCMSCLFTFNTEEELSVHLKSHFDGTLLNKKSYFKVLLISWVYFQ